MAVKTTFKVSNAIFTLGKGVDQTGASATTIKSQQLDLGTQRLNGPLRPFPLMQPHLETLYLPLLKWMGIQVKQPLEMYCRSNRTVNQVQTHSNAGYVQPWYLSPPTLPPLFPHTTSHTCPTSAPHLPLLAQCRLSPTLTRFTPHSCPTPRLFPITWRLCPSMCGVLPYHLAAHVLPYHLAALPYHLAALSPGGPAPHVWLEPTADSTRETA